MFLFCTPLGVMNPKTMKKDKGREGQGVIKLQKWADVIYGWPPKQTTGAI